MATKINKLKVLFINPPRVKGFPVVREERFEHKDMGSVYPPLSLLTTAAVVEKAGYEVDLIDANGFDLNLGDLAEKLKNLQPDVVMMRIGFDTQEEDLKVVKLAKKHRVRFVIVRNHIISDVLKLKLQLLQKHPLIDIWLNQEPEGIILPLLKALTKKNGLENVSGISYRQGRRIINNPDGQIVRDLDSLPFPAYHLLPNLNVYYSGTFGPPYAIILGSRGCPFRCAFCAYGGAIYRTRSAQNIVDEIEWLGKEFKTTEMSFFDDVSTIDSKNMIDIAREIIKRKLKVRLSVAMRVSSVTAPLIKILKKAGCDEICVGIESGSPEILKNVNKGITIDQVETAIKICHQCQMKVYAMFIIGLPGETKETVLESLNLVKKTKPFYSQFCFATPFPNTPMYSYYQKGGYLLSKKWQDYFPLSNTPIIRTKDLSKDDLINMRNMVYRQILFDPMYLLGHVSLTDWRWNMKGLIEISKRMVASLTSQPVR